MKHIKRLVLLALFMAFNFGVTAQDDYELYSAGSNCYRMFYKSSVKIITEYSFVCYECWEKEEPKSGLENEWRASIIKDRKAVGLPCVGFSKVAYQNNLMHINCENQKMRIMKSIYYDEDGKVIESSDYSYSLKFNSCSPESVGQSLIESVCDFAKLNKL